MLVLVIPQVLADREEVTHSATAVVTQRLCVAFPRVAPSTLGKTPHKPPALTF